MLVEIIKWRKRCRFKEGGFQIVFLPKSNDSFAVEQGVPRACQFVRVLEGQHLFSTGEDQLVLWVPSLHGVTPGVGAEPRWPAPEAWLLPVESSATARVLRWWHWDAPVASGGREITARSASDVRVLEGSSVCMGRKRSSESMRQNVFRYVRVRFGVPAKKQMVFLRFYRIDLKAEFGSECFSCCVYRERFVLFSD